MSRVLFGLAYAVGIPVIGFALVLSGTALHVLGPSAFDDGAGAFLVGLLTMGGYAAVLLSQMRYDDGLVFLGVFVTLIPGLYLVNSAIEERMLIDRGELTTCTVVDLTRREQATDDGIQVRYEYDVVCARPEVTTMTAGRRLAQPGDEVQVRVDPDGRRDPRPASYLGSPGTRGTLGAAALGVGIVLRLLMEFRRRSRRLGPFSEDGEWYKEQRRIRHLNRARARGDRQARVAWLLPFDVGRPGRDRPPTEIMRVNESRERAGSAWAVQPVLVHRCRVALPAAPPAVEDQIQTLCDLYLTSDQPRTVDNVVAAGSERLAADEADLRRWHDAADAYLSELAAVNRDLWQYWIDQGQRLGVSWGRSRLLQAWQDHVRSGYERLVRAADAYRPVFEEISRAAATTTLAERDLKARNRRLQDWADRRLWYLKPTAEDGLVLVRSDVSGEPAPDGVTWSLRDAYDEAMGHQDQRLVPVDWDEASLRVCDAELAELSAAHPPVGATRSGRPMTRPSPVTFADWFLADFEVPHDLISDRDTLTRHRQERERARARRPIRPRSSGGGSWPTAYGTGDFGGGAAGGGDYGGSDYGGGYSGGGDYGGGHSGGGDYGGGFSVGSY